MKAVTNTLLMRLAAVVCAVLLPSCAVSQPHRRQTMTYPRAIQGQSDALQAADAITALRGLSLTSSAMQTVIAESKIPFLQPTLTNRRAWRVEFAGCSLVLPSAAGEFRDREERRFVIRLDAETGQLIDIESHPEGGVEGLRPEPSAESAERQLRTREEVYVALPADGPKVTFVRALDSVLANGGGSPFLAKEICGVYVMHSKLGSAPRPVWVITLRGIPPLLPKGPGADAVPIWQRNRIRYVVDANTGDCLFATNTPLPE
jgi:hypothetical protein